MNDLEAAIYAKLLATSALTALVSTRIFNTVVPRGGVLPCCVFSLASGIEENLTQRRSQRDVYLVKGIARSRLVAGQISDAALTALRDVELNVSGWGWFWTAPMNVVSFAEPDPAQVSEMIYHSGWEYVIRLAK